ncbi:DUF1559 family PulG-like putative transporter [Tautonia marina]|uniref:DUF1559 family PulG-like putative transporter n=1 Tax=Tautonia marina TaxID=2653855 RepID=UPI0012607060|nr:DUF1559 domain-containing protein [Tautonia marina]
MNDAALFDEAFGQLDDDRREQLDLAAASDPSLSDRRARLRRAVSLLLETDDPEPPSDLAARTTARMLRHADEPRILEFAPSRPRMRWVDVGVAAAVMLIGMMSLVPAVRHQQQSVDKLICTDNLRQIGLAMNQYAATHQSFPYVDPACPASYVGSAYVLLNEVGLLHDHRTLDCPCDGEPIPTRGLPRFAELLDQEQHGPGSCREDLRVDYAYHLGNLHPETKRLIPLPFNVENRVPLVADQPPFRLDTAKGSASNGGVILVGNSPNHAGAGQNVLFTDGRVEWRRTRWVSSSDYDIYLNQCDRTGPGVHLQDAVLTPCVMRFRD